MYLLYVIACKFCRLYSKFADKNVALKRLPVSQPLSWKQKSAQQLMTRRREKLRITSDIDWKIRGYLTHRRWTQSINRISSEALIAIQSQLSSNYSRLVGRFDSLVGVTTRTLISDPAVRRSHDATAASSRKLLTLSTAQANSVSQFERELVRFHIS